MNGGCPGAVLTPLLFRAADRYPGGREEGLASMAAVHPLGRNATPEDIANAVLFLVSERARQITGQELAGDGGSVI